MSIWDQANRGEKFGWVWRNLITVLSLNYLVPQSKSTWYRIESGYPQSALCQWEALPPAVKEDVAVEEKVVAVQPHDDVSCRHVHVQAQAPHSADANIHNK